MQLTLRSEQSLIAFRHDSGKAQHLLLSIPLQQADAMAGMNAQQATDLGFPFAFCYRRQLRADLNEKVH